MIIAMSETTPDLPNNSPLALARRVKGYIAALISLAQSYLEPDDTAQTRTSNQMEHGATIKLRTHIHRLEYQLRCYILWLAAQMLERANTEPGYLDTLRSFTSNAKAQLVRARGEDQPPSNSIILEQELELRRLTARTPSIGGFQILPSPSKSRGSSRTPGFKFTPDPLRLVDASRLLARMNRLPKVLKRADAYAVKLVLSTVSDPPFKGQEAQGAGPLSPLERGSWRGIKLPRSSFRLSRTGCRQTRYDHPQRMRQNAPISIYCIIWHRVRSYVPGMARRERTRQTTFPI